MAHHPRPQVIEARDDRHNKDSSVQHNFPVDDKEIGDGSVETYFSLDGTAFYGHFQTLEMINNW